MYSVEQIIDTLKLASNIVGLTHDIAINSCIYEHLYDDDFDVDKDIYVIKGSIDDPITMTKILNTFEQIQLQFKTVEDSGRSYFYEGMSNCAYMWMLHWGS